MQTSKIEKPKSVISKLCITLGLIFLFMAIFLVYLYSILRILGNLVEYSSGPGDWFDHIKVHTFLDAIGYDYVFRTIIIVIIVGFFLLSFFCMLLHNRFVKKKDHRDATKIFIIHDDILHVAPEIDANGQKTYHPEKYISDNGFYTMDKLFHRKGIWKIILKIANYLVVIAILAIFWVFYRASDFAWEGVYYPFYLSTDEAYFIINSSVTYLLVYYLLRCPDFVKSLAATGFKRIYLKKMHLHETFIGILLAIGGILLVMNGEGTWAYLDRAMGLFLSLLGVFMIGRDWKDFVMGKFLRD